MTQVEITKYKSSEGLISKQQGELRRKVNLLRRPFQCKLNIKYCKNNCIERVIRIQLEEPFQSRNELGFA